MYDDDDEKEYDCGFDWKEITCCNCGVLFAVAEAHQKNLYDTGKLFYCPNGHSQHYSKPVKLQLEEKEKELEDTKAELLREQMKAIQLEEALAKKEAAGKRKKWF